MELEYRNSKNIELDDAFFFSCNMCGKCCTNRDDLILTPLDIFRLSKLLDLEPKAFIEAYGEVGVESHSGIPLVRLKQVGKDQRCPFLTQNRCIVQKAKPAVCALYPVFRYASFPKQKDGSYHLEKGEIKYLLTPLKCGSKRNVNTVNRWLESENIPEDDVVFLMWCKANLILSKKVNQFIGKADRETLDSIWYVTYLLLYTQYDMDQEFRPQFENNMKMLFEILDKEVSL